MNAIPSDSLQGFVQRFLISREWFVPHGGVLEFVDDLQEPVALAVFVDFYRHSLSIPRYRLSEWRMLWELVWFSHFSFCIQRRSPSFMRRNPSFSPFPPAPPEQRGSALSQMPAVAIQWARGECRSS